MHLGIIMDGNRRWAKERELPVFKGHREGANRVRQIARYCKNCGIKTLTLYAFSTENWNRDAKEVYFLMKLLGLFLTKELEELQKEKIKLKVIGQKEKLPLSLQKKIAKAEALTAGNENLTLVLAISYGGRAEIVQAFKRMILGGVSSDDVTEEKIGEHLYTVGLPDPDLIIRTSGEMRTSGFLMWQAAYSELYFTDKYWPDFSEEDLDEALAEYSRRQRRFGK
ncbi:MAG: isoprenyl transferase [Candidatus Nealsonbacteria bacterium]|nr:isoprenyl transferase [Candidatus Nealsonbacteria bacterium]